MEHGAFGQAGTNVIMPTQIVGSNPPATTASAGNGSVIALHRPMAARAATAATSR